MDAGTCTRHDSASLLVTVGADHHPFDRIIEWVDDYLTSGSAHVRDYFCQHGTAHPPRVGEHWPFLPHWRLQLLMERASVVVTHGGPGCIVECLRHGHIPIAVPRLSEAGEAVDDHQGAFCELLAERRQLMPARTEPQLHTLLDKAFADPNAFATSSSSFVPDITETVNRFALLVSACPDTKRGRLLRHLRSRPRSW